LAKLRDPNCARIIYCFMPDTAEYLERMKSFGDGNDVLSLQRETSRSLARLTDGVSVERLCERPQPEKWSVAEILAHLAEDEIATAWRYRQMIESPGCSLSGFDQDIWARLGDYPSRDPADSLRLFTLVREANLRMLGSLSADEWQRHGVHAERGSITVQDLARHMAGHDANHLEQIRKILSR
jgi:hypothetical protein